MKQGRYKTAEPYPGFNREARAVAERAQGLGEAAAEPLPGPLADAFAGVPDEVAGLRVRPMVHWDFVALRLIKSPLLEQLRQSAAGKHRGKAHGIAWSDEQGYEMIYQFTRPVEEVAEFFTRHGAAAPAEFRKAALREIGFKLGPVEVGLLVKAVARAFVQGFETRLKFEPKDPGPMGFPAPPAGTASAGGSTISASS